MNSLAQDIRFALRTIRRGPGVALIAVVTLALGIGTNITIFTLVNAVLSPLPFKGSDRLVRVYSTNPSKGFPQFTISYDDFQDWKTQNRVFEDMAVFRTVGANLNNAGEPEQIVAQFVSANYFEILRVAPTIGRLITAEDDSPGGDQVVLISRRLWERRFDSDPNVIARSVTLDGQPFTVIGVIPDSLQSLRQVDAWMPMARIPDARVKNRFFHLLGSIARLKPGVSLQQARAEMTALAEQLEDQYPSSNSGFGATVVSLGDDVVGQVRPALLILLGAVVFVLLIACANVANLLLARTASRQRELAIRLALGARRVRVVRQLLTESLLLSVIGGGLGLLAATWGSGLLVSRTPAGGLPRIDEVGVDGRVLLFSFGLSLIAGLIFGIVPALQYSRPNLSETLKEGGRTTTGLRGPGLGRLLVVSEISLALVLLIGAGLMLKSFTRLRHISPGFAAANRLTLQIGLPASNYETAEQKTSFYNDVAARLSSLQGVEAIGAVSELPLIGRSNNSYVYVEGHAMSQLDDVPTTGVQIASIEYLRAMGIPLLRGRDFRADDGLRDAPPVAIVSESMAKRFWPEDDPIGKRFKSSPNPKEAWTQVIGVAGDVKFEGLSGEGRTECYLSNLQLPLRSMTWVLHTRGDPNLVATAAREAVWSVDPQLPVSNIQTLERIVDESVARNRLNAELLGSYAALALALASIGIYGVVSHSVGQRTHELGIRIALGGPPASLLRMVIGRAAKLAAFGVAVGLAGAFILTRVMRSMLYGVSATDPIIFVSVGALLFLVAIMAAYVPARRATKVDPLVALRYE
jgi:putative ABC transport system permease protein